MTDLLGWIYVVILAHSPGFLVSISIRWRKEVVVELPRAAELIPLTG